MINYQSSMIQFGTLPMLDAWAKGVEHYQPRHPFLKLEEECGVSETSYENLRKLIDYHKDAPRMVLSGPQFGTLWLWGWKEGYLATGFAWGYEDVGLSYFSKTLDYANLGTERGAIARLSRLPETLVDVLYTKHPSVSITPILTRYIKLAEWTNARLKWGIPENYVPIQERG